MDGKYFYKNQAINNDYNQKTNTPSMIFPSENNKNKSPYDKFLNKYSYTYLHAKKLNNINKTNNYQSLIDCTEPEPQIFHDFHQNNYKNNSFELIQNKKDKIKNNKSQIPITTTINNKHITNRNNNKKLLEEYFQLKNRNSYITLNSEHNNQKKIEYNPLIKKNKSKRNSNNNEVKDKNIKKSKSLKNDLLQIYEPEKNITNSPSFTPIKNKYPNNKSIQTKENNPFFNSKSDINNKKKKISINISTQRRKFNNKILKNEDAIINSKRIKNVNENAKYRMGNRTPTSTRKNLAPSKIKGIWVDQNDINYNKTYSIDKSNNSNSNISNYIYSSSYLHSNYSNNNNNNISSINSTELYWKRKEKEKEKKLEQIRTERILKEEKELQDRPKINQNSKKILDRRGMKNVDVFNRLSDLSQIKNHNMQMEKIREKFQESHTPYINDNSRRMKRTIDDLYTWKNKNERKKTESANNFNKMIKRKQIKINPLSEEILREKKSDYLNKRVEDRLLEQGRMQQYKNEMERQKYLDYITASKKYVNNEYINIHSRYLESPNNNNFNNYKQKNYKSCDRINKKETKSNYKNKNLSINNNFDNSFNNYEDNSNFNSDINSFNNQNMSEKEIYFKNNESKLINGNIDNYIYRNNNINDCMVKQQKDNINNNPNLLIVKKQNINNNYKYFPINSNNNEVLNNKKENSNFYKYNYNTENNFKFNNNKNILDNQNYIKSKGSSKLINKRNNNVKEENSNNISYKDNTFNDKSKFEENEIINIRKHLNQFYENKKKLSLNNSNSNKFNEYVNEPQKNLLKVDSIKNDLLKGLLNNNNNEQNCDYYNTNYNRNNKQVENLKLYSQNNDINNVYNFNNFHLNNKSYSNSNYNDKINQDNFTNENEPKYNFRPDLIKDINKVPKSSGLNFNLNKNINSFQFHFNQNNINNKINEEPDTKNQNTQINYLPDKNSFNSSQNNKINNYQNQNKYTIEDSININGLTPNTNLINIDKKNKDTTGVNNITKENTDNIENERRKNDLLQMINFSSNLRINNNYSNNNNNNNQSDYQNSQQKIYIDYENFNGVQSYEGM